MAVRHISAVLGQIICDNGAIANLNDSNRPYSMLLLMRRGADPSTNSAYMTCTDSGNVNLGSLYQKIPPDSAELMIGADSPNYDAGAGGTFVTSSDWTIIAATNDNTGPNEPKVHAVELVSGAQRHQATGVIMGSQSGGLLVTKVCFGVFVDGAGANCDYDIACAAVWDGVALSNGQIDALQVSKSTQAIYDLGPTALWDFNQTSVGTAVIDLTGGGADQISTAGTSIVNGDDPPGWIFGLTGGDFSYYRPRIGWPGMVKG